MSAVISRVEGAAYPTAPASHPLRAVVLRFRREFMVVGVFSLVVNLLMLTPTLYLLQVYDRVLSSMNALTLLVVSIITLFLFGVMAFAEWARSRLLVRVGVRLDLALSDRIFRASFLSHLNPAEPDPGKAFRYLITLRQFMTGNGVFAFFDSPWVLIYVAVLWLLHPVLGVVALCFALLQTLAAWLGHRASQTAVQQSTQSEARAQSFLQAKLRNVEALGVMGMMPALFRRWQALQQDGLLKAGMSHQRGGLITAASKFLRQSQQAFSLGVGAWLVIRGELTPGAMIAANVLMTRALAPIDLLVMGWPAFLASREAWGRLEDLLRAAPREPELELIERPAGRIEARNLTVRVPGRTRPVLDGICLALYPGTVTVVVGPSGSGKSTLARCLLGILPGTEGEVLLDGTPVSRWSRESLGKHIGYLPQDIELFDGTIAENIARMEEVDPRKVIAAAKAAELHGMILRMPKGYDTRVGPGGGFLSGGQRQRVGLARALFGEPAVVVLDEPNANLDDVGEKALREAVARLREQGSTVLLISHQRGALELADQLLVLEDGRLGAGGPRDAVIAALRQRVATPTGFSRGQQG